MIRPVRDLARSKLARDTVSSLVLRVGSRALGFGVAVLLARTLGKDGYGIYSYALALVTLLALPAQVGLPTLLVRETAAGLALERPGRVRGVWIFAGRATGALSLILAVGAAVLILLLNGVDLDAQAMTMIWAIILVPLVALGNLRGAALRGLHRIISGQLPEYVLRPALLIALIVGAAIFTDTLRPQDAMSLHVVAAGLAFGIGALMLWRLTPPSVRSAQPEHQTRAWLVSAVPLALIAGLATVNSQADILMLGIFESSDKVGLYRVATQTANLAVFGLQAVNMVVMPRFAQLYAEKNLVRLQRLVTVSARVILAFSLIVVVTFVAFGQPILSLVFGKDYVDAYIPLVVLLGGQLVSSTAGSVGHLLNMAGYERDSLNAVAVAAAINIVLNLLLIPLWGMVGAATATATSLAVRNIWSFWAVRRRTGINSLAYGGRRDRP